MFLSLSLSLSLTINKLYFYSSFMFTANLSRKSSSCKPHPHTRPSALSTSCLSGYNDTSISHWGSLLAPHSLFHTHPISMGGGAGLDADQVAQSCWVRCLLCSCDSCSSQSLCGGNSPETCTLMTRTSPRPHVCSVLDLFLKDLFGHQTTLIFKVETQSSSLWLCIPPPGHSFVFKMSSRSHDGASR
jgi:hypothetical protein